MMKRGGGSDAVFRNTPTPETVSSILPGTQPTSEIMSLNGREVPKLGRLGRICFTGDVAIKNWSFYEWTCFAFLVILWTYGWGGLIGNANNFFIWETKQSLDDPQILIYFTYSLIGIQTTIIIGVITGLIYLMSIRACLPYGLTVALLGTAGIAFLSLACFNLIAIFSKDVLEKEIYKYIKHGLDHAELKKSFALYQSKEDCCGVRGPDDWYEFSGKSHSTADMADSNCSVTATQGCGEKLSKPFLMVYIRYFLEYLLGSIVITLGIIIVCMVYQESKGRKLYGQDTEVPEIQIEVASNTAQKSYISTTTTDDFFA